MFVYGTDFQRNMNKQFLPEWIRELQNWFLLFMSSAAILIWIARRKLHLPRDDFFTSSIDIFVAFIGVGDLQMRHKVERWFFCTLMIGSFFMTAMFASDLFLYNYEDKRIRSISQLPEMNLSAYATQSLAKYNDIIKEMLRFETDTNSIFESLLYRFIAFDLQKRVEIKCQIQGYTFNPRTVPESYICFYLCHYNRIED